MAKLLRLYEMLNHKIIENIPAILVLMVVFFVLYLSQPEIVYKPVGIALPLQVSAVNSSKPPYNIARINAEMYSAHPTQQQADEIIAYAKQLAATVDADGLIVNEFGATVPDKNESLLQS